MKPDLYTKFVLTVIAVALSVVALNQFVNPVVQAQAAPFGAMHFSSGPLEFFHVFNSLSGEVVTYEAGTGKLVARTKLSVQ